VPLYGPAHSVAGASGAKRTALAVRPCSSVVDAVAVAMQSPGSQFLPRGADVDVPSLVVVMKVRLGEDATLLFTDRGGAGKVRHVCPYALVVTGQKVVYGVVLAVRHYPVGEVGVHLGRDLRGEGGPGGSFPLC